MAVTKIHGIKTTVDKAIEYICNPDKTDQNLYISSFACSPETAVLDFKYTLDHTHDCRDPHNTNKALIKVNTVLNDPIPVDNSTTLSELAIKLNASINENEIVIVIR